MIAVSIQFLLLSLVVIVAGVFLAYSADRIAEITRVGRLLVGSVLLAAVTSLPELTVDLSAVRLGFVDLAVGDLFGSSLVNLLILAGLDLTYRSRGKMLSREAAAHALSATLSISLTALAGIAVLTSNQLPMRSFVGAGVWSWVIAGAYLLGVRMVFLDQRVSAHASGIPAEKSDANHTSMSRRLRTPFAMFLGAAIVLCIAGPRLAHVAGELAELSGLGKTFVGTTLVALCTSLPELVASITALRLKAFDLVIGNVFGSNAFNMVLFFALDVVHAGPLFAAVSPWHAVTAMAVIVTSAIAVMGQLYQVEQRRRFGEPDALLMILVSVAALYLVYRLS
jgi:cation:H+ antiporter